MSFRPWSTLRDVCAPEILLADLHLIGWEVLMYSAYRQNLTPSDYYLFRSLQNSLDDFKNIDRRET